MEFMKVVNQRRSCREFLPTPIAEEVVDQILEAGRLAPTPGNGQNHYFGVIRDPQRKEALAQAAGGQMWIASAPVVIALCAKLEPEMSSLPDDDFGLIVNRTRYGKEFIEHMNQCPDRKAAKTFWVNGAPTMAGQQIYLAAVNFGLNGCWVGYLDIKQASEILHLPEDMICLYLLPLGYAKAKPGAIDRKSKNELVFFEQWEMGK